MKVKNTITLNQYIFSFCTKPPKNFQRRNKYILPINGAINLGTIDIWTG